ncbi:HD domain-containing protein [Butyrivibrio sp. FCS014]|uniref:HD domain-containing protein n=1 Tax=Butyrivibrio sp. FCS014 TaxID=1408304 RepID=UPI000463AE4E|nr:HD domain-containing protein [Butyrivibrio sp. FCS014]
MNAKELLNIMHVTEKLKDTTRHCYTSKGRHESVAEHSWRITLMAYFVKEEFPEADMDKVIKMCLIHDLGEIFTGDIPSFNKTEADTKREDELLFEWVATLPEPYDREMNALLQEMNALETTEAKIYKALDNMEAVLQHNESDIATWEPHEYELNLTYGNDKVAFSPFLQSVREEIRNETIEKIKNCAEPGNGGEKHDDN